MTKAERKKGKVGRPADPIRRVPLSLRVTPDVKGRLEVLAAESGRSISQEAELRLERSFLKEGLLTEALVLRFGKPLAGLLMTLGSAMELVAHIALLRDPEADTQADLARRDLFRKWMDHPEALHQAALAAELILKWQMGVLDEVRPEVSLHTFRAVGNLIYDTQNAPRLFPEDDEHTHVNRMLGNHAQKPIPKLKFSTRTEPKLED